MWCYEDKLNAYQDIEDFVSKNSGRKFYVDISVTQKTGGGNYFEPRRVDIRFQSPFDNAPEWITESWVENARATTRIKNLVESVSNDVYALRDVLRSAGMLYEEGEEVDMNSSESIAEVRRIIAAKRKAWRQSKKVA